MPSDIALGAIIINLRSADPRCGSAAPALVCLRSEEPPQAPYQLRESARPRRPGPRPERERTALEPGQPADGGSQAGRISRSHGRRPPRRAFSPPRRDRPEPRGPETALPPGRQIHAVTGNEGRAAEPIDRPRIGINCRLITGIWPDGPGVPCHARRCQIRSSGTRSASGPGSTHSGRLRARRPERPPQGWPSWRLGYVPWVGVNLRSEESPQETHEPGESTAAFVPVPPFPGGIGSALPPQSPAPESRAVRSKPLYLARSHPGRHRS